MFRWFRPRSIVLLYHRIAELEHDPWSLCVTPAHFAEHLQVLQSHRRQRLADIAAPARRFGREVSVAITFDDGYADNYHAAGHLLREYDTPATFFIATGYIGGQREFWWDELERVTDGASYPALYEEMQPQSHGARRTRLDGMLGSAGLSPQGRPANLPMTLDELRALASEELFEIGAHTMTHPLLAAQPAEVQAMEIRGSKDWLEAHLDRPVRSFSYPYGGPQHYNTASVQAVREAGLARACTTADRALRSRDDPFEIPRIPVVDMDGDQFHQLLFS